MSSMIESLYVGSATDVNADDVESHDILSQFFNRCKKYTYNIGL